MNSTQKTAFITGVTGQDGAYLSEFLLKKDISRIKRRTSLFIRIELTICTKILM
jgi:GDPmannose 4,6-dehydratase